MAEDGGAWIVRTPDSVTMQHRWRQRLVNCRLRDKPFSGQGYGPKWDGAGWPC